MWFAGLGILMRQYAIVFNLEMFILEIPNVSSGFQYWQAK